MLETSAFFEALRDLNQTEFGGATRFLYSSNLSGPDGDLPIEAIEIEIPVAIAERIVKLRDVVADLSIVPNSFAVSYHLRDVGIGYSVSNKLYGEQSGISDSPRTVSKHWPIIVELAEVCITKKEGIWIQLLTEGPSVVQMHISRAELDAMAEPLTKKRPRM